MRKTFQNIISLAPVNDWPDFEERRTVKEENLVRVAAQLPIRGTYIDIEGVIYAFVKDIELLNQDIIHKRYTVQKKYTTGVKEELIQREMKYMSLKLRLIFFHDATIKRFSGINDQKAIKHVRNFYDIRENLSFYIPCTPAKEYNKISVKTPEQQRLFTPTRNIDISPFDNDPIDFDIDALASDVEDAPSDLLPII